MKGGSAAEALLLLKGGRGPGGPKQQALSLSRVGWLVRGGKKSILESRLFPDLALIISRGFCFKAGFGQHVYKGAPIPLFLLLVGSDFLKMNQAVRVIGSIAGVGTRGWGEEGRCIPASGKDSCWLGRRSVSQIHWSFLASPSLDVTPAPGPLLRHETF